MSTYRKPSTMRNGQKTLTAGDCLGLSRGVGIVSAVNVGIALALGSYNDITASTDPASFILPFTIAAVAAGGLGAGWHVGLGMAAQAVTTQTKSAAFGIGLGLVTVGMATSAHFLAAKLGGAPAIQKHQTTYLSSLRSSASVVGQNNAIDAGIVIKTKSDTNFLEGEADAEGKFGKYSGKSGYKGVYLDLKNAATSLRDVHAALKKLSAKRVHLLTSAKREIDTAGRAIAEHDRANFRRSVSRATSMITDASQIRLSSVVSGLSLGTAPGKAGEVIRFTASNISEKADEIEANLLQVSTPIYVPMDAKTAVTTYPAPLPWLMATLLETLPLLMLCLLLALPAAPHANGRRRTV